MIILMNYIVPILTILCLISSFYFRSYWIPVIFGVVLLVYTVAQPTVLPKGTVPAPRIEEYERPPAIIIDRGYKVMTPEERDKNRNQALKEIDESIESRILKSIESKIPK